MKTGIAHLSRTFRIGAACAIPAALLLCAAPGLAQTPDVLREFQPDYFSQFAPRTALDMVERIPGFSISGGNNSGRGLGEGGANILINGARISGKSASARETLERIPADTVVSLKIVDGASLSIAGLTGDVVDVTVRPSSFSGTWEWRPELRQTQRPNLLRGKISITGEAGPLSYTLALDADADKRGSDGREFERDAAGEIYEIADEKERSEDESPEVSLSLAYAPSDNVLANFNAIYQKVNGNERETSDRRAVRAPGVTRTFIATEYEDETVAEISGDVLFPALGGQIKLIGVTRYEDAPVGERVDEIRAGILTEREEFYSDGEAGEYIARAEYSRAIRGHDWQIAGEAAFNYLERSDRLFELQDGELTKITLDDPNVRVEEDRAQITITHNRALTEKLDLQASISVESSELSQTGNAPNTRSFVRPKGFANFSYAAAEGLTARLEIARRVGQLDFGDFISDVDLEDDQSTTGNSDLVPRQYWNYAVELDKRFDNGNALLLRVFFEDIEDLVGNIPAGDGDDTIGNIKAATAYGAKLTGTVKGQSVGFDGAQLDFELFAEASDVTDPVTGNSRDISGRFNSFYEADFRHDIIGTDWAWGFGAEREKRTRDFSPRNITARSATGPFSNVFIEHKDLWGLTANLKYLNPIGTQDTRERIAYFGRRDQTDVRFTQARKRAYGKFLRLTLSGTF